jgi:hypothetical protein
MKVKEIIETQVVKFQIKGITDYMNRPKIFIINHDIDGIELHSVKETIFGHSMNVEKFGPTCMWLFSYDMMGNKTRSKVKYSDITIVEEDPNKTHLSKSKITNE